MLGDPSYKLELYLRQRRIFCLIKVFVRNELKLIFLRVYLTSMKRVNVKYGLVKWLKDRVVGSINIINKYGSYNTIKNII